MADTSEMISLPQALELAHALLRNGWKPADVKWLSVGERLAAVLPLVRGTAEIKIVKHLIDLAVDPFVPDSCKGVEHHEKGATDFEWDPAKVRLHISENQKDSKKVEGNELRKELAKEMSFNANLLDYLLKNPHLIPEEWKKDEAGNTRYIYIYFWGTIYRGSDDYQCVRYLYWNGTEWDWDVDWLDSHWESSYPAACLAK